MGTQDDDGDMMDTTNKHSFQICHRWKPMQTSVHQLCVRNSCRSTVNCFSWYYGMCRRLANGFLYVWTKLDGATLANMFYVQVLWFLFISWLTEQVTLNFIPSSVSVFSHFVLWFWRARIQKHQWKAEHFKEQHKPIHIPLVFPGMLQKLQDFVLQLQQSPFSSRFNNRIIVYWTWIPSKLMSLIRENVNKPKSSLW